MSAYSLPCAIQCAELAARRESIVARQQMKGRIAGLASISASAPFIGFFATVLGISNSFQSYDGPKPPALIEATGRISEALIPGAIGLLVALLAFWFYRYLGNRLEGFELDMESATVDLVNRLRVYLNGLKNTDPELWRVLSRRPAVRSVSIETQEEVELPRFRIARMYRNGLLEIIWPRLKSDSDKELVLHTGFWVCVAYAVVGYLAAWSQNMSLAGVLVLIFFLVAAFAIRGRSMQGPIYVLALFSLAAISSVIPHSSAGFFALFFGFAATPFIGMLRAIRTGGTVRRVVAVQIIQSVLLALSFAGACSAVLFGTELGFYFMRPDGSSIFRAIYGW